MNSKNEDELKDIKKQIVKTQIIGAPDTILLGPGLYGMFAVNGGISSGKSALTDARTARGDLQTAD